MYFPRRVIPMLPEKLSNGLCSLNPNVDRLAMVCEMSISHEGQIERYEFYPAVFRSHARLTYTEVWQKISSGKPPENLALLYAVFKVLLEQRTRRGAIDFETVETRMVFDARGKIEKIVREPRNDAHRLIEECMLAANVCAGNFLAERDHPVLYRVHDVPAAEKVGALREFLAELGLQLPGGEMPRPKDYAQLLERIRKRPDFALLQTILLRSLKQAVYSPSNLGHFGLAFEAYVHFTSPIRRYPDLLVHRAIKAVLIKTNYSGIDWEALGRHCSETERRADDASRDVENWLKCYYMRDHVGETFAGTITGVTPFGLFVTLDDYFVDGLVHISELGRDYFQFDAARHMLLGERTGKRFRLADRMKVKLVRVDLETRKIDLVPGMSTERAARRLRLPRGARAPARRPEIGDRDLPRRNAQRRARQGPRRRGRARRRAPDARADQAPRRLLRRRPAPGRGGARRGEDAVATASTSCSRRSKSRCSSCSTASPIRTTSAPACAWPTPPARTR